MDIDGSLLEEQHGQAWEAAPWLRRSSRSRAFPPAMRSFGDFHKWGVPHLPQDGWFVSWKMKMDDN